MSELAARDYERWAGYDSYAYLTIYDGPEDDDNFPAPAEAPEKGDPNLYSLDPVRFSEIVGIEPTRVGLRGDRKRNGRYVTRNYWETRSTLPRDAAPHEHVRNVLAQFERDWDNFIVATKPFSTIMHIVSKGSNPGLCLERREIARLAEIKASLDVDMYPDSGEST